MDWIFEKIVGIVSELTGSPEDLIKKDRHEEYVNYRVLLVGALSKIGFSDRVTASCLGLSRQGVNWLRNSLDSRIRHNRVLANIWQDICKRLSSE